MTKLKKIDALSAGKIYGIISLILGLIFGIVFAAIAGMTLPFEGFSAGAITIVSIWSIILIAIAAGFTGFITGIVFAALFNLVTKWKFIDGLEIEIEEE